MKNINVIRLGNNETRTNYFVKENVYGAEVEKHNKSIKELAIAVLIDHPRKSSLIPHSECVKKTIKVVELFFVVFSSRHPLPPKTIFFKNIYNTLYVHQEKYNLSHQKKQAPIWLHQWK